MFLWVLYIAGFGQTGPYSQRGGYDNIAAAVGGLMHITGPSVSVMCCHISFISINAGDLMDHFGYFVVLSAYQMTHSCFCLIFLGWRALQSGCGHD